MNRSISTKAGTKPGAYNLSYLRRLPPQIVTFINLAYSDDLQMQVRNTYNRDWFGGGGYSSTYPDEVMDRLLHPRYTRPGKLPLYIALEGKNRIELYKHHRSWMYAYIRQKSIPEPAELTLIRLKPFNVWAIRYGNDLKIIPFSEPVLAVYQAYGVAEGKARWDLLTLFRLRKARLSP